MKLVHGGDTVGYREKYGRDALDFSANVSPLGTPEAVARAIGAAASVSYTHLTRDVRLLR